MGDSVFSLIEGAKFWNLPAEDIRELEKIQEA
jgi:hypothetical protein